MENSFLDTQITFKNDDNKLYIGEVRQGKIIVSPIKDIKIHRIGYQIVMEGRGRTSPIKKIQSEKILLEHQTLHAGETFEFDIDIKGMLPGSYKGKGIQFTWKIETFIELEENSYSEIRNDLIKGFKLFKAFNPNKVLAEERDLFIYQEPQPYVVIPDREPFTSSGCLHWFILIFGTIGTIFLMEKFPSESNSIFGSIFIGFLFIATVGTWLYKRMVIGKIISKVENLEEDQFIVSLDLSKNWKGIKELQCQYRVIEEVVDRRGTSNSTSHSKIYKSGIKKNLSPKRNSKFVFDFPKENLPATYKEGDVSFLWEIEIKAFLAFGLTSSFTQPITVKKGNE